MDSYLEIAHKVLKASRRPMSAKGILNAAFQGQIVPEHLRGKTQHKTLQARLSEDILYHRSLSRFYRTEPGLFFLCEFISNPDIPDKFKQPFPARRRTRDLQKGNPLAIKKAFLENWKGEQELTELFAAAAETDALKYLEKAKEDDYVTIWTFSVVRRDNEVLSYRIGRYRDDREAFANKRTIGFPGALTFSDRSLFSQNDYGASDNALDVLLLDLDLSPQSFNGQELEKPQPLFLFEAEGEDGVNILLIVLEWDCPEWFEPTTRKLSLNDPRWLDMSVCPNNLEDFEPWGKTTLNRFFEYDHAAK